MNAKNSCRRENSSIAEGLQNRFFTFPFFIVLNIIEFIYSIMCHLISWKKTPFSCDANGVRNTKPFDAPAERTVNTHTPMQYKKKPDVIH